MSHISSLTAGPERFFDRHNDTKRPAIRPEEIDRMVRCVVRRVIRKGRAVTPFARRVLAEVDRHVPECGRSAAGMERIVDLIAGRICAGLPLSRGAAYRRKPGLHETVREAHPGRATQVLLASCE